jgi:hypothetical protein
VVDGDLDVGHTLDDVDLAAVYAALGHAIDQRPALGIGESSQRGRERARALLGRLEL